jgi:hypothetical protein
MKNPMKSKVQRLGLVLAVLALPLLGACNRNPLSGSKLTSANYDQVTLGMSKRRSKLSWASQPAPRQREMLIFKKTTYRYEDGKRFAMITFRMMRSTARTRIWGASLKPEAIFIL